MPPPPNPLQDDETEDWLITYADAITLLMAFFVMLLNFTKIDIPRFEEAMAGIAENIGGQSSVSPTKLLQLDLQDVVFTLEADQSVKVATDDQGVTLELASSAFYKPGSAILREEALPVLTAMGELLAAPKFEEYLIEVEGHTDDDPINTPRFPSNWELSAGRAAGVVRFLHLSIGIDHRRLKVAGFAETRPKVPNRRHDGTPIKDNQATNRRVIIRVHPMSPKEREEIFAVPIREPAPPDAEPEATEGVPEEEPIADGEEPETGEEVPVETIRPGEEPEDFRQ